MSSLAFAYTTTSVSPDFKKVKMINYDYAKYGASAERRRLIERWEKEVNSIPKT